MVTSTDSNRPFFIISILYAIWHTTWEWWRLLMIQVQLSTSNQIVFGDLALLQTLSNVFILLGSLIFGQLVDTFGPRISAILSIILTGILYTVHGEVESYTGLIWLMPLFIAHQLPSICETLVAMMTEEKMRLVSTMRLRIPLGIAAIVGPCLAIATSQYLDDLDDSQLLSGVVLMIISLPLVIFLPSNTKLTQQQSDSTTTPPPSRRFIEYAQVIKNEAVWKSLLLQFLLDGPYQYYEYVRRQYLIGHYLHSPVGIGYLLITVGAVTIFANTFLIQWTQRILPNRRTRLQITLLFTAMAYCAVGVFKEDFYLILIFMPLQMAGVSIIYADLLTQLTIGVAAVDRRHFSKVISLARFTQLLAITGMSLLAPHLTFSFHFSLWCYGSAVASVCVIVLLQFIGTFMNVSYSKVPSYYIPY